MGRELGLDIERWGCGWVGYRSRGIDAGVKRLEVVIYQRGTDVFDNKLLLARRTG